MTTKNKTTLLCATIFAAFAITFIAGCKKGATDLASGVVGYYHSDTGSMVNSITVNKINDNTISVSIVSPHIATNTQDFTGTHMNSATSFTLDTRSDMFSSTENIVYSGSGSFSGNNIVLHIHEKNVMVSGGAVNWEDDVTLTGSK